MLVIGHRGASGLAPENTLPAFRAGYEAGADMLELDVRLTADHRLVVIHDALLLRTHYAADSVASLTYRKLQELTRDNPVPLLEDVLREFFGKILLNIEIKSRHTGDALVRLLRRHFITCADDWDLVLISSFKARELMRVRRRSKRANLALLHHQNPFAFIAYHHYLKLTAVGFHRLYLHRLALEVARRAGIFIYAYTVDRPSAIHRLEHQGVQAIVTNYPDKCIAYINAHAETRD